MDEETQKIITEQMKHLPEDVATAIISVEYQAKLQDVVKRQRLMIDQAGKLEMETTLVMIGLEQLGDYIANLTRELEISAIRAGEIAEDVNNIIFKPVRKSLENMAKALEKEEEADEEISASATVDQEVANLDRDQILNEIENPATISGGNRSMNFTTPVVTAGNPVKVNIVRTQEIEVRPAQEIKTIPGEGVKNIVKSATNTSEGILQTKMTSPTTFSQQVVDIKTETKLPEIKKKGYDGVDPYREPLD